MHPDWLVPDWRAPGVGAVMTTRRGGFSAAPFDSMNLRDGLGDDPLDVQRNQRLFAEAIGATPVTLNQVHGARVVRLDVADAAPGAPLHEADAAITTEPGVACTVQVADCLPVLLAAPGGVGAAHAGWRGLAAGVVEATLDALCEATGSAPSDVHAWLGACIGPAHFEVGGDVVDAFDAREGERAAFFRPHTSGKWLADLPGLARQRLAVRGVTRVTGGTWCTVADPSRFFSFRRDKVTGRMAAAVWRRD
jgi:YfiH family protein